MSISMLRSLVSVTASSRAIASTSSATLPCICRPLSTSPLSRSAPPPVAHQSPYTLPRGLVLNGVVLSTGKMAQTATVEVERRTVDHKTLKEFKEHKKYLVHDPEALSVVGDLVTIRNCKPVSKRKRFELLAVTKGARERAENMAGGESAKSL